MSDMKILVSFRKYNKIITDEIPKKKYVNLVIKKNRNLRIKTDYSTNKMHFHSKKYVLKIKKLKIKVIYLVKKGIY